MARLIPARSACLPRMTLGERRLAQRLEDKLEDDYLVWYDVPVGVRQRRPDFVVLHPRRGLLVLEVKDWKLDTLHDLNKYVAELRTERGLVKEENPLLKARGILLELVDALKRDPALVHPAEHAHAGKLVLPWGHGVVLSQITRAAFEQHQLDDVLPPHLVACQDEMTESADAEAFQQRLWAMFAYTFGHVMTLPQIDRVRWHLFPEIRVQSPVQSDLLAPPAEPKAVAIPDLVRVMDLQQEQLARSLGDGHRVIHGVAGSGKTMILGYRCLQLARSLDKPILVLCFNRTLAARLAQTIGAPSAKARIDVRSFHAWCSEMLRTYHVPAPRNSGDQAAFFAAQVQAVIDGVERGAIPRAQYGAVLIDEGHDFEPEWLRLVVQMIDPQTNSLLLLYDDAQAIYAQRERRKISFASLGIKAVGRTTILKLNYRNTWEVLAVAKAFAGEWGDDASADEDAPALIAPESVGRHGPPPQLIRCASRAEEAEAIAAHVADAHDDGCAWDRIAVIWRHWNHAEAVSRALARRGIPHVWAKDSYRKEHLFDGEPSVKLVSMHSSKGLEFDRVFIPAIDTMPAADADPAAEAKLLYVAMTRTMERLVVTGAGESVFVERVERAVEKQSVEA
jgi:hypothetical protein